MSPQINFLDQEEISRVREWFKYQDAEIQVEAAVQVAHERIKEVAESLFKLRYSHSQSTFNAVNEDLRSPSIENALEICGIDPEKFANLAIATVRKFGTTRSDDFWRACGVGRPRGRKNEK